MNFADLPQTDDYEALFADDIPLLDARAPVEYRQGTFPCAQNLPLMDDDDRHAIGIEYKERGQSAAIALGKARVSGAVLRQRLAGWKRFIEQHPKGALFCFRGGLRSKITQQLIYENTGVAYPRARGGYKAMRRFLIEQTTAALKLVKPLTLGGRTGVGKTLLLQRIRDKLDLEAIYHHRGSVFGAHVEAQPAQSDAENYLSIALLKLRRRRVKHIVVEDESAHIGSRTVPPALYHAMRDAPLILLNATDERRVALTFDEYVTRALGRYRRHYGRDQGLEQWANYQCAAIDKIHKRLGGQKHKQLRELLAHAIRRYRDHGDAAPYREWIHRLLVEYYDPMYDYQLNGKQERVVFTGEADAALRFLRDEYGVGLL